MDYKELIEISQKAANEWRNDHTFYQAGVLIDSLCSAVEDLLAERDAAVADIPRDCKTCKHQDECAKGYEILHDCWFVASKWQWRGIQKE